MSNSTIIGVDCSSYSIGYCILNKNSITPIMIFGGQQNDFDTRVEIMYKETKKLLKEHKPKAVFIEGAIYLKNVKTTLMIARVIDMVIANCIDQGLYYQVVDNKVWKKHVLGNGNATKEQIMNFAKTKWEINFSTQDLADSASIALHGFIIMGDTSVNQ